MKWVRRISLTVVLLPLVLSSVWAWPSQLYGTEKEYPNMELQLSAEAEESAAKEAEQLSTTQPIQPEDSLKSATQSLTGQLEDTLGRKELEQIKQSLALMESAQQTMVDEYNELIEERDAISEENNKLAEDLARVQNIKDESGTKAYLMLDAILGFSGLRPDYGVGLTIGTRIGNSLMVELGTDYMIGGSLEDISDFRLDDFTFRAGIGWMF